MAEQGTVNLYFLLLAGTEAMLLLASGFILFVTVFKKLQVRYLDEQEEQGLKHRQELSIAGIQTMEAERRRFAADLHDDIGHDLLTLRLQLRADAEPQRQLLDGTLEKIRQVAYDLYPPGLGLFGLSGALADLFEQAALTSGIQIDYQCAELPPHLSADTSLAVYRIAKELLNNSMRYSGAEKIMFECVFTGTGLSVRYADDGCGFDPGKKGKGLGLLTIEQRAVAASGRCTVHTSPGNGFRAQLEFDLQHACA